MLFGLVLLFESAIVIVSDDLIEERLELPLDLLKGIRVEAELVHLFELFSLVGDGANIELKVVFFGHFYMICAFARFQIMCLQSILNEAVTQLLLAIIFIIRSKPPLLLAI